MPPPTPPYPPPHLAAIGGHCRKPGRPQERWQQDAFSPWSLSRLFLSTSAYLRPTPCLDLTMLLRRPPGPDPASPSPDPGFPRLDLSLSPLSQPQVCCAPRARLGGWGMATLWSWPALYPWHEHAASDTSSSSTMPSTNSSKRCNGGPPAISSPPPAPALGVAAPLPPLQTGPVTAT